MCVYVYTFCRVASSHLCKEYCACLVDARQLF